MRIGIDIDGVIFNSETYFMALSELYDCKVLKRNSIVAPEEANIETKYDWTDDERKDFVKRYICGSDFGMMPLASEVINDLRNAGNELYCLTLRGYYTSLEIDVAKKMLEKAGIVFDKYFWVSTDKAKICAENGIDVLIDDRPKYCLDCASRGIRSLYFRSVDKKQIPTSDILVEVHNWGEVYRKLSEWHFFDGKKS